jgi:recombination protein RecA
MSQFDDLQAFLAHARSTNTGSAGRALASAPVLSLDEMRARQTEQRSACWGLTAMRGRLVEISGRGATAVLTTAAGLVVDAQTAGEPVVWVTLAHSTFFPPDLAASGVDLAALVVVRVADRATAMRAAERVLRSGAIGLVVIDLGAAMNHANQANQMDQLSGASATATHARLITLAQQHDAAVVCLTEKTTEATSLGSLVSLRAEAMRKPAPAGSDYFATIRVLKDKRRGPGFETAEAVSPPAGMV